MTCEICGRTVQPFRTKAAAALATASHLANYHPEHFTPTPRPASFTSTLVTT